MNKKEFEEMSADCPWQRHGNCIATFDRFIYEKCEEQNCAVFHFYRFQKKRTEELNEEFVNFITSMDPTE